MPQLLQCATCIAGKETTTASDRCHTRRPHSVLIQPLGNQRLISSTFITRAPAILYRQPCFRASVGSCVRTKRSVTARALAAYVAAGYGSGRTRFGQPLKVPKNGVAAPAASTRTLSKSRSTKRQTHEAREATPKSGYRA